MPCCAHARQAISGLPPASAPTRDDLAELAAHYYVCLGMSTYRIAEVIGLSRQQVRRLLARAEVPVKPRGAGRPRQRTARQRTLDELMVSLYVDYRQTSPEISALTGVPQRTVRDRLRAQGVRMRTRGRMNREDRRTVPAEVLEELYVAAGLSAADVGALFGLSRHVVLRTAHDLGLPVRIGGPEPTHGPSEIELIDALYADPLVQHALSRHGIARYPPGGSIWQRFPVPLPVSRELAEELYVGCGLAARHIELLTGQPAHTVFRLLKAHGIARRTAGGRTPFMRRWRAGVTGAPGAGGQRLQCPGRGEGSQAPSSATFACTRSGPGG
jgi:transposase